LLIGDFANGWKKFEWRWQDKEFDAAKRDFTQPLWLGDYSIAGKTVLLHAEQGFGDTGAILPVCQPRCQDQAQPFFWKCSQRLSHCWLIWKE
jgi:hypothetical protein